MCEIIKFNSNEYDECEDTFMTEIEKDCEDTLLRLNAIKDKDTPIMNKTLDELDTALDRYNVLLYDLIARKANTIKLLNENNIIGLEGLLSSLRDIKLSIVETQKNIDFCIDKINYYNSYIYN